MNRLASETSPYLLQHSENPVDWYPWGSEAFERASAEDKPVFLSVGYSSCHWCHVMAHESFESEEVAAVLNAHFVSVKVDREERPDVDEAYMTAVQLASGRGGWPMTVFLTPDKKPFFAGTYFPRDDRGGYPGFLTICRQVASLWKEKRPEIEAQAEEFASGLREVLGRGAPATASRFDRAFVDRAVQALSDDFDEVNGGFGSAPKFPPHTAIDFLLRYAGTSIPQPPSPSAAQSSTQGEGGLRARALHMALFTLEKMALGGIRDHVGGGFHRYSTDAEWHLPHFEKMLYDNALMAGNLQTAIEHFAATAEREPVVTVFVDAWNGIWNWLQREMTAPGGGLCSALDADSEGEEGAFYTWTRAQIERTMFAADSAFWDAFGVCDEGNFREESTGRRSGRNVLHARQAGLSQSKLLILQQERSARERPPRDDKVIVSWNGLGLGAYPVSIAEGISNAIFLAEGSTGHLPHQIVNGTATGPAFLDDYAALAVGLFGLGLERRDQAHRLTREMIDKFWDERDGGFFSTSAEHENLFGRTKPVFDQPIPSGNALALRCLIEIGDFDRAWRLLDWALGWMERAPQATEGLYAAALPLLEHPRDGGAASNRSAVQVALVIGGLDGQVILRIPQGMHVNGHAVAEEHLVPTMVDADADIEYPEGEIYEGEVRIGLRFRSQPAAVAVRYQACTETECLAPVDVVVDVVVDPSDAG